jgi:hypothetical protein
MRGGMGVAGFSTATETAATASLRFRIPAIISLSRALAVLSASSAAAAVVTLPTLIASLEIRLPWWSSFPMTTPCEIGEPSLNTRLDPTGLAHRWE